MSGGSYGYIFNRIHDIDIRDTQRDPKRAAFQKLLTLVADAMHDIEWVDSGDYGYGDEHKAIDACFAMLGHDPEVVTKAAAYDALKAQLTEFFKENREQK